MNNSEYYSLLSKLDEFIRKYYKNQLIRGLLYSIGIVILFYLSVVLLEYYGQFNTAVRTVMFYLFIVINGIVLTRLIVIPLLKLNRIGKVISNEEASRIIGSHFSAIQDKLLNILQLHTIARPAIHEPTLSRSGTLLVEASINQKIRELKPIPFVAAIDLRQNKRYLKYAILPLSILFILLFIAPGIIKDSTKKLIKYGTYYEKRMPFQFVIQNKELQTPQQEDFLLSVKIQGQEIPAEVFINVNGSEYRLSQVNKSKFDFLFKNVQRNTPFSLSADGYTSTEYELVSIPKPVLLDFNLQLHYPAYIERKDEIVSNTGDLIIPAGTKVTWNLFTQNTKQMKLGFPDTIFTVSPINENRFSSSKTFLKDASYFITTSNEFLQNRDSVMYSVNVIPDSYPIIQVEEKKDSVSLMQLYYAGNIKDDYGFSKLTFNYRFLSHTDSLGKQSSLTALHPIIIPIAKNVTQQSFYHFWNMEELAVAPGDKIEYYFEVWDNDAVNGSKSSRSSIMIYNAPTQADIEKNTEKNNAELKNSMEESIQQAKDLKKKMEDLYRKILEKKTLSWEEKKKMEEMLSKQKKLEEKVTKINKDNSQNNQQQSQFKRPSSEMVEKQEQLQKLMEQVMTDDMKKLYDEIQKMMDKLDKGKIQEALEKLQLSNKEIEKELDRTLELFKKMEFETKMEQMLNQLRGLSNKQDELANKSIEKKQSEADMKTTQDSLNKRFEDIQKTMDDLEKKNNQLDNPVKMPDTKSKEEDIKEDMQNSSKQLSDGKNKKASESQKGASQKMNQLVQQLQDIMNQNQQEQEGEDENALREILNNLIQLSFDQEAQMKEVTKTNTDNPQYVKLSQQQKKLKDDAAMIEDSLLALSKRQAAIASVVNREIAAINSNMDKSIELMGKRENRYAPEIAARQQFSMTSINNLALMLNESLNQMQSNNKASGQCTKPGSRKKPGKGQKPSAGLMREMQEQLKKQMEGLKKEMENGMKQGNKAGNWSEQMVKIAAQQEAMKQMMMQMQKDGGINAGDMQNTMKMIEESQKDIVNRQLNEETIKRQQQILNKMLDFEKAEKERDTEQKRQATEAKNEKNSNLSMFIEYNKQKEKESELLKTIPPNFNNYYKGRVSNYFNNFTNQ